MNYIVKLRNKSEIVITDKQAEQVMKLIADEAEFIKLNGELYARHQIATVEKGDLTKQEFDSIFGSSMAEFKAEHTLPPAPSTPGAKGSKCRGVYSIQFTIHQISLQSKKDWAKHVKDKTRREKTRLAIRAKHPNRQWCDYKEGECNCPTDLNIKAPRLDTELVTKS